MITTSPKGVSHAGRRIPKVLSREYFPGPLSRRAVEIAVFVTGSSAPPSVTQIGLPQWAFAVAMDIEAMIPIGPKGLSSPRAVSSPPPNSQSPARNAQGPPGRNPSISIKTACALKAVPSERPEQLLSPVTCQQRSLHQAHDQRRQIVHPCFSFPGPLELGAYAN